MERMNQQEIPIMQERMSNVNRLVSATPNSHKGFIYSFIKIRPSGVILKGRIVPFDIGEIIRFHLSQRSCVCV